MSSYSTATSRICDSVIRVLLIDPFESGRGGTLSHEPPTGFAVLRLVDPLAPVLLRLGELRRFADLGGAVAVHLFDRDPRERVVLKKRQQVMRELPFVVLTRLRSPAILARLVPMRGELAECRVALRLGERLGLRRTPDTQADLREHFL
jgi:hypothetical protein